MDPWMETLSALESRFLDEGCREELEFERPEASGALTPAMSSKVVGGVRAP